MTLWTIILWGGYITIDAVHVFNWDFICNVNVNLDGIFWLQDLSLNSALQLLPCNFVTPLRHFTITSSRPRSGELRTPKLKSHLVRTQSLNVLPL